MDLSIIEAKARRNKLNVLAGCDYRDGSSQLVTSLNKQGKDVYLGIQSDTGLYTVIGAEKVYFSTDTGKESEISNSLLLEILQKNSLNVGKSGDFDFVPIDQNERVWVKDGPMMCALWNIILLFGNNSLKS